MKQLFTILTPYGAQYQVFEGGRIKSRQLSEPSNTWLFLGLQSVNSNFFIPLSDITPELLNQIPILYKNKNPKFTVRDLDNGTERVWGNSKYHGVKYITFC